MTVRMLASREAADRLATRRVESMVNCRDEKKNQIEGQHLDLEARFGKGKGKNREERNNKRSENKVPMFCLTHVIVVLGTYYLVCNHTSAQVPGTSNPGEMCEQDWLHPPHG